MPQSVTNIYEVAFDSNVKREYQGKANLRNLVYTKGNIVGDKIYFRKVGQVIATEHNPFTDLTYGDPGYSQVFATFKDYNCAILSDRPQSHNFTFDDASIDAEEASDAIARRLNQTIIDALKLSTTQEVGTSTEALTVKTLLKAKRIMDDKGIPETERYFIHTSQQLEQLMSETKATSSDYVNVKALIEGNIDTYLGFKFVLVPSMIEGGLPADDDAGNPFEKGFIFHKRSVGFGTPKNGEIKTSKDWLPQKQAWQINATLSCGSVIIDEKGVLPVFTKNVQ